MIRVDTNYSYLLGKSFASSKSLLYSLNLECRIPKATRYLSAAFTFGILVLHAFLVLSIPGRLLWILICHVLDPRCIAAATLTTLDSGLAPLSWVVSRLIEIRLTGFMGGASDSSAVAVVGGRHLGVCGTVACRVAGARAAIAGRAVRDGTVGSRRQGVGLIAG